MEIVLGQFSPLPNRAVAMLAGRKSFVSVINRAEMWWTIMSCRRAGRAHANRLSSRGDSRPRVSLLLHFGGAH